MKNRIDGVEEALDQFQPMYLVSFAVCLSRDVTGENLKDTFFIHQLLSPHFQQRIFGRLALQVEEVVVVELAKSWR